MTVAYLIWKRQISLIIAIRNKSISLLDTTGIRRLIWGAYVSYPCHSHQNHHKSVTYCNQLAIGVLAGVVVDAVCHKAEVCGFGPNEVNELSGRTRPESLLSI
jgi:hypothetical protein